MPYTIVMIPSLVAVSSPISLSIIAESTRDCTKKKNWWKNKVNKQIHLLLDIFCTTTVIPLSLSHEIAPLNLLREHGSKLSTTQNLSVHSNDNEVKFPRAFHFLFSFFAKYCKNHLIWCWVHGSFTKCMVLRGYLCVMFYYLSFPIHMDRTEAIQFYKMQPQIHLCTPAMKSIV